MFFDSFQMTFIMTSSVVLIVLLFKPFQGNSLLIHYTLYFCAIMSTLRFMQSLRALRALPLSTNNLALMLFLLPIANAALYLAMVGFAWLLGWGTGFFNMPVAAVVLPAGLACLNAAFCIRFGLKALVLMAFFGISLLVIFIFMAERFHFPPSFFWVPGLCLMASSFALLRRWLTVSQTYRFRGEAEARF